MPRHPDAIIIPNAVLWGARKRLPSPRRPGQCMSRGELADAVNRALDRLYAKRDLTSLYVDFRWVGKLERGESRWPSTERRAALRTVFGVASDHELDLYSPRRSPIIATTPTTPPAVAVDDWEQTLDELQIEWRLLVDNDKVFGPAYAFAGVSRQLDLLDALAAQAPEQFSPELNRMTARYAESAAWLSQSLGDDLAAERWTRRSLDLASRIGDTTMIAWAHYRSSQHWLSRHVPSHATAIADIAASHTTSLPAPMRAAIRVQQAHALAAHGSPGDAMKLLDEAHRWAADRQHGKPDGDHGSYCTTGYIEVYRGACLRLANRPHEAVGVIDAALPTIPRIHRQDYASALLHKATAHAAAQQPEAAAATAHNRPADRASRRVEAASARP